MKKITLITLTFVLWVSNSALAQPDFSGWAKYADNLKSCKAGTFSLPDILQAAMDVPNPSNITYQIIGMDANTCKVFITRTTQELGTPPSTMKLKCSFKSADLPALSKTAMGISNGSMSTDDPSNDIINKSCQQVTT